jgi:hypothetical protein
MGGARLWPPSTLSVFSLRRESAADTVPCLRRENAAEVLFSAAFRILRKNALDCGLKID